MALPQLRMALPQILLLIRLLIQML